ncbi:MAG: protein kinase [Chloroflexi bacterium]|nr:protein kinase [Chloroflexota bacterium]
MSFSIGENVGAYRIAEQLGQGGMATVYKAYHAALDRYVALKVLHPAFNEDKSFELRFQREARVVAKLEHPHIVPIYDYAEHEHRPYLVMKFIPGETLKARLLRGPLTSEEIQDVVDSVGSALGYAHRQGILHRDIKPSNVLISTDGVMYLADFGLARIAQMGESTLSSDSIMGTPQYISPEQAMGKKELDAGTDIYSFGVMLYEMVVGQVPFNADTPFSIIHDHIYTPLPMPRAVNPKVPETVERVLLKALSKERADRYASVEEMSQAFKDAWVAAGVPMRGTAITLPHGSTRTVPRETAPKLAEPVETVVAVELKAKRFPWAIAAGLMVLLVCGLVGLAAFRNSGIFRRLNATTTPLPPSLPSPARDPKPQVVATMLSPNSQPLPPDLNSPQLKAAYDAAQLNPDDPNAHLALAVAYWDAGLRRQALEALTTAANLAPMDQDFLLGAAKEFHAREAWTAASAMYIRLMRAYPPNDPAPTEIIDAMHESVYKSAGEPEFTLFLQFEMVERTDQAMGIIMRGRSALTVGKLEDARNYLNQARGMKPDLRETALLEAEILIHEKRIDEARAALSAIGADQNNPEWIHIMAEGLMKTLP